MTGAHDKLRQVRGSWRKMFLSPNDEVANSSKKQTQFKTGRHKPYPVSDQNGRNLCPVSTSGAAHTAGAKNALQIMGLAAYASETNKGALPEAYYSITLKVTQHINT